MATFCVYYIIFIILYFCRHKNVYIINKISKVLSFVDTIHVYKDIELTEHMLCIGHALTCSLLPRSLVSRWTQTLNAPGAVYASLYHLFIMCMTISLSLRQGRFLRSRGLVVVVAVAAVEVVVALKAARVLALFPMPIALISVTAEEAALPLPPLSSDASSGQSTLPVETCIIYEISYTSEYIYSFL